MAPLQLKGITLGEKHRYYNELVKEVIDKQRPEHLAKINYDDPDLDNILKIDIASSNKNVEYILDVFKCEDMLYVSRAIKQSNWLVTDEQYAYIINPKYLHSQLFPYMTSKAINKLILYIRLNLKEEKRVEEFFNFYKEIDATVALKWLPNCSLEFTLNAIKTYADIFKVQLLKRLCEKSITVLETYVKQPYQHSICAVMNATTFLINDHFEKYLEIMESVKRYETPKLKAKYTKLIMERKPQMIFDSFEKYADDIHLPTFVKYLRAENINQFLLEHHKNKKLRYWFCHDNLKPFILMTPPENRLKLVQKFLNDQDKDVFDQECEDDYDKASHNSVSSYHLYKYAPFKTAFVELKKLIRAETSPNERVSLLEVLLYSAGRNMLHIQTILQYFREKHINEPFKFKIKFINSVLEKIQTFKLSEPMWKILNELFSSMEVYSESQNNVQLCVKVAIVQKILHNEDLPEILGIKFCFETLKPYKKTLNEIDSDKIFTYLYNSQVVKIDALNVISESELSIKIHLVENVLKLLKDWDKDLLDFPFVLTKIKELVTIKKTNSWNANFSCLYNIKKSWRKHLFVISLDLWPTQDTCVNALKHDPQLLSTSKHVLESVYCNDSLILNQFLNKLRMYWSSCLGRECVTFFLDQLNRKNDRKGLIRHLFVILPQKDYFHIIKNYVPKNETIDWNKDDKMLLDIRKNIAKRIHITRPQASLEVVLWYAKGDYLQFAIPSVLAVLSNMSSINIQKYIKSLIEAPVSLQKYGIRAAIDNLKSEEIINIFSNTWKNTKNSSIRADLFKCTFKLLCKEKNVNTIETIWMLLNSFIDTLTDEENKVIYDTLAAVDRVPLCVRVAFWKKSYNFLKTLPPKCNCDARVKRVIFSASEFMEIVDVDFISEIFLERNGLKLTTNTIDLEVLMSRCLLSVKDVDSQYERYKKIIYPSMELYVASWNIQHKNEYLVRLKFCKLLKYMCQHFKDIVVENEMVIPVIVFDQIQKYLELNLPTEENYTLLRAWKLVSNLIKTISHNMSVKLNDKISECKLSETRSEISDYFNVLMLQAIPKFGKQLQQYLREDIKLYYPSIYISFGKALNLMCNFFCLDYSLKLQILKTILNIDIIESYLLVIMLIPKYIPEIHVAEKTEIMDIIHSHPSPEVKIHYYHYQSDYYLDNF
ncbi:unnamed protein product [Parnassius apollo]|uniref:(apollo) hypothetical protein n=1 Tax=Parnassius apollo TaxID=110799 RepID=A0A8S3XWE9_PARAO|nr:unnamed protein product [Parnassius apollo]